jgi:hypothetical protein
MPNTCQPARPAHGRRLAGSALDALHRQPRLQGKPAHDGQCRRYLRTSPMANGRRRSWTGCPACGVAAWAMAGARSLKPSARQIAKLDYSPAFQYGHALSFELANKIKDLTPGRAGLRVLHWFGLRDARTRRSRWRVPTGVPRARPARHVSSDAKRGTTALISAASRSVASSPTAKAYGQAIEADHLPHTHAGGQCVLSRHACQPECRTGRRVAQGDRACMTRPTSQP